MLVWEAAQGLKSRSFTCGHCGKAIASERGWWAKDENGGPAVAFIYVCHQCRKPTFLEQGSQSPGVIFGAPVSDIPEKSVADLYEEARKTTGAGAFTAAVLCCRKLLMHVAVSKGAKPGESFVAYVQYLADKNFIPPDAKDWVDHIRQKGNEANHEIAIMIKEDAEELLAFCEMLLKVIYEFPAAVKRKIKKTP
jgi:hypothetical protein